VCHKQDLRGQMGKCSVSSPQERVFTMHRFCTVTVLPALFLTAFAPILFAQAPNADKPLPVVIPRQETALFNGRDFSGWYTFLPSKGRDNDPEKVFTIEDGGVIHVSGKEFGYFATNAPYANYKLRFEVKWGEKKWPPRETAVRDSGVLVHTIGPDKVWPKSFECQVQENDFGDIFHIDGISSVVNGKRQNGRVVRSKMSEKPNGQWNVVELIVNGDAVTNIVNGVTVNTATQITTLQNGKGSRLNFGKIAFQSEGAEVYYRNITVRPL
jgi:hypothetical protein